MATKTTPMPRNGVDVPTLFATLDAVKDNPEIAKFQFRATNTWMSGTHSMSTINGFYGAMQEQTRANEFMYGGDHPAVLVGKDNAPTPACATATRASACRSASRATPRRRS